jgi:hypothetical protein
MESQSDYATMDQEIRDISCINFTAHTAKTVFAIKVTLSSLAIVANLVAVIVLIFFTKKANRFMYRLVLYLLITDIFQAIAIILISLPISVPRDEAPALIKPGWSRECVASGFLSVASLWMGNIIIFWIALYLAWIGIRLYLRTQNHHIREFSHLIGVRTEVIGVLFLLVVPFFIASIPFYVRGNMYGLAGLWCWIKIMNESCGDLQNLPLILDLLLFYAPLVGIMFLTIVSFIITVTCCCRGGVRRHDAVVALRKSNMKDIVVVLVIPLAYCVICLLLLANRIHSAIHENQSTGYPYTPLWMTHAVADPVRVMLPALAYLFNPAVWKDICRVWTHTPAQDSPHLFLLQREGPNKDYGSCNDTATEDDDITDEEYVRTLLKVKTKT